MNWIRISRKLCVILCGAVAVLGRASADSVALLPVADTDIEQFSPNINFGNNIDAVSGALGDQANHEVRRALYKFDPSSQIRVGAIINSVTLELWVVRAPTSSPGDSTFDVRRVLQDWNESGATWNSRLSPAKPWSVAGAGGSADARGTASSSVFVTSEGSYVFPSTPELVADVQDWINQPAVNFGWLLISEDEVTPRTARRFATREDPVKYPVLTIDYIVPPPSIDTQPQSRTVDLGTSTSFMVAASGVAPLTFQWQLNGQDIPGATDSTLLLNNVRTNDAGSYVVIVQNPGGSTNSQTVTLTVVLPPVIPPFVHFLSPTNGARFPAHANLILNAEAFSSNGVITSVEFLVGASLVGVVTELPYSVILSNLAAGNYQLTARATDDQPATNTTAISITVFDPPTPILTSPDGGQRFGLGTNVTLEAAVQTVGTTTTKLEFFAGAKRIAQLSQPPFRSEWHPARAGDYRLTAVATDDLSQRGTSAPVAVRVYVVESVRPTLAITKGPRDFSRLTAPVVSLAGTARDNIGLDHVEVQVNDGPFQTAKGTTSWNATIALVAGINVVRVRSIDLAGNVSLITTRFLTYVVMDTLVVRANGRGSVQPQLNGASLEIGKLYSLVATPGLGQLFNGWEGAPSQGPRLNFIMRSNLVLTANFLPNLFPGVQGSYAGLVLNTNAPLPESTGSLTLQVLGTGEFSGRLMLGGKAYSFAGRFSPTGEARFALLRPSLRPLALDMNLDLTNGADAVQGTVTDGNWTSQLLANRNVFNAKTRPAEQPGPRPFELHRTDVAAAPVATGSAMIKIAGGVNLSGTLSDGRKFSFTTSMGIDRTVPIYISLTRGTDVLAGWLEFGVNPEPSVGGDIFWMWGGTNGFILELETVPAPP